MRTTRLTKIAMVIFLSMIFFLGVQRPVLAAERQQKHNSENTSGTDI